MRRNDRAVDSLTEITSILEDCQVCRLAMCDEDMPYIVPLNFGYTLTDGVLTLYFHCAPEGRKVDILRRNPRVCFEMDIPRELTTGDIACAYSMN